MVKALKELNIEKMLYDLYSETQKNKQKYVCMGDELKRLITIFSNDDTMKPTQSDIDEY
jgi:hypothetical protein